MTLRKISDLPPAPSSLLTDLYMVMQGGTNYSVSKGAMLSGYLQAADLIGHEVSTSAHPLATSGIPGFMSAADKTKLDSFAGGANQNAFGNILVSGQTTVSAATPGSSVTLAGSGVTITTSGANITFTSAAISGDVTISAGGTTSALGANVVTNAKLAQMGGNTFKGNATGGTANPTDLSQTQATAMINVMIGDSGSGGIKGLVPAPAAGDAAANRFLKANGTWTTVSGSGTVTSVSTGSGLTGGPITGTGTISIAANGVTNGLMAAMSNNTIKGNISGSSAAPADLTATQTTAMLNAYIGDSGAGGLKGLVPAPGVGDAAAGKFLKADGTWTAITQGGSLPSGGTVGQFIINTAPGAGTWHTLTTVDVSDLAEVTLGANEFLVGVNASAPVNKSVAQVQTILNVAKHAITYFIAGTVGNGTYVLSYKQPFAATITSVDASLTAGTCTLTLTNGGSNVTGVVSIAESSANTNSVATGNAAVAVGNTVTVVVGGVSSAANLAISVNMTRS